jgi:hypothetical protein
MRAGDASPRLRARVPRRKTEDAPGAIAGNANLPIGAANPANREIGVPGNIANGHFRHRIRRAPVESILSVRFFLSFKRMMKSSLNI